MNKNNPLHPSHFKHPGFIQKLSEILIGRTKRPLDVVQVEVTSACMGECTYCPHTTQNGIWKSRHLDPDTMAALWPLFQKADQVHLQGWGEPFLHPHFFDFVEFAINSGCRVSTTTCGLIMNEKIATQIINSGIDVIAFSLTGTDQLSNSVRKKIDFNHVCNNIKTLKSHIYRNGYGPQIHIAYLMLADRIDAVSRLPELINDLNVDSIVVSTLDYLSIPEHRDLAILPTDTDKIEYARSLLERVSKINNNIFYSLPDKNMKPQGCRENIHASLYVDAEGNVSPCVYLNVPANKNDNLIFGNILQENIWNIWQKENYANFRQNLCTGNIPGNCLSCPKRLESFS